MVPSTYTLFNNDKVHENFEKWKCIFTESPLYVRSKDFENLFQVLNKSNSF